MKRCPAIKIHGEKRKQSRGHFSLDSARQAGKVTSKERNTGEHRELQADGGQQGLETPPHKPGPLTGLKEGLARAQEAGATPNWIKCSFR